MSNKYDNIDYCLNMLYDFVYTRPSECYELKYVSSDQIQLDQLKKQLEFDVSSILKEKIVFEEKIGDKLIFKRSSSTGYPSMIRVSLYSKNNLNYNDLNREELIDMKANYLLSGLAINDIFKYVLFPIMNFDVKLSDIKNKDVVDEINKNFKNIDADDTLCIQVFEHYFKLRTLKDYLNENYKKFKKLHWQVLVFQIIYALYKIQKTYPSFRHNNLNLESIYVYVKNESKETNQAKIGDILFDIPNMGFEIKITNFYKSYIDNTITNKNIKATENQYYDIYSIINSISLYLTKNNIKEYSLLTFIDEVIPEKIKSETIELDEEYYFKYITNILSPLIILSKNNFFIDLINKMKSSISNNPRDLDSYKMKDSSIEYLLSSSSLTETGYGARPSMLGKSNNKKTITGQRTLAVSSKYNKTGGASKRQVFNDYGELETEKELVGGRKKSRKINKTRHEPAPMFDSSDEEEMKKKKEKKEESSEELSEEVKEVEDIKEVEEDVEAEEAAEEGDEEAEDNEAEDADEDAEDADEDLENLEEPKTEGPPVSGTGAFFRMLSKKPPMKSAEIERIQSKKSGKTKRKSKSPKRKSGKSKPMSRAHKELLNKLPENFEGMLPDWMQNLIPQPQLNQAQGQMQGLDQLSDASFLQGQMMPPQMQQMQQMQQMPQMMQQMPQMMPQQMDQMSQQMQFSDTSNKLPQYSANFTETSANMNNMSDLFEPSANANVNTKKSQIFEGLGSMKQAFSHTANESDNSSFLPSHLLMNPQQAKMMSANMPQQGGKDNFFF